MEIINGLANAQTHRKSIITIGNFDGVHFGHQSLISQVVDRAAACDALPTLITFEPHPVFLLKGTMPGFLLTLPQERYDLFASYGIQRMIIQAFDEALRTMPAVDYVSQLHEVLNPCEIWVGSDFVFGYQRQGDVDFLRRMGEELGFRVNTPEAVVLEDGTRISSSLIREALVAGKVRKASRMLGRPYQLNGEVVSGSHRGRTIGFPTANVAAAEEKMVPPRGVYAAYVYLDDVRYESVTNIGFRPTFNLARHPIIESHILDFDRDIYGQILTIDFIRKIRNEKKFDSIARLIGQINEDIRVARNTFWSLGD